MVKQPITKALLQLLAKTGRAAIDFHTFLHDLESYHSAYLQGGYSLVKEIKRLQRHRQILQTVTQLRRANYIRAKKIGKRLIITLTDKGFATTISTLLQEAKLHPAKFRTVVIFDIPQSQNSARRRFRLLLRQGGFVKLQQSVWVSKNDTYHLITQFIRQFKLESWINVFYAKNFFYSPHY